MKLSSCLARAQFKQRMFKILVSGISILTSSWATVCQGEKTSTVVELTQIAAINFTDKLGLEVHLDMDICEQSCSYLVNDYGVDIVAPVDEAVQTIAVHVQRLAVDPTPAAWIRRFVHRRVQQAEPVVTVTHCTEKVNKNETKRRYNKYEALPFLPLSV